jgi:mRNA interferase MazF
LKQGDVVTVSAQGTMKRHARPSSRNLIHSMRRIVSSLFFSQAPSRMPRFTDPAVTNGLDAISHVMVDKVLAYPRAKCGPVIGHLSATEMPALSAMLSVMIRLAD